jgi:hypothetical protein
MTGQGICLPLDADGFVSENSLKSLSIEAMRGIAENCNITHTGQKKNDLIDAIISKHPKAKLPQVVSSHFRRKRNAHVHSVDAKSSEHMERDTKTVNDQFMLPVDEPNFVSTEPTIDWNIDSMRSSTLNWAPSVPQSLGQIHLIVFLHLHIEFLCSMEGEGRRVK